MGSGTAPGLTKKKGLVPYSSGWWDRRQIPSRSCNNTALLQLLGHTSAGSACCGTDQSGCVLATGDFPAASGGRPFRLLLFSGRWFYWLTLEVPLLRGISTEPQVFFDHDVRKWSLALHPDPPKKGLVPHFHVRWGVQQITSSSFSKHFASLCVRWTKKTLLWDLDTFVWHHISLCWVIYLLTLNNRS